MNCKELAKHLWNPCEFLTQKNVNKQYALLILNRPIIDFCSGPEFLVNLWQNAKVKMTIDGGTDQWLSWLKGHNINLKNIDPPNMVTGDFDSISQKSMQYFSSMSPTDVIRTEDQNETDYTKALKELTKYCEKRDIKLDTVLVLCDMSGRFDQLLSNIHTMFMFSNVELIHMSCSSFAWLLREGENRIKIPKKLREDKEWCALVPIGNPARVSTTGLKWNLDNRDMEFGHLISTSNTYNGDEYVTVINDNTVLWSMGIENLKYGD